jgi:hypothetical protein
LTIFPSKNPHFYYKTLSKPLIFTIKTPSPAILYTPPTSLSPLLTPGICGSFARISAFLLEIRAVQGALGGVWSALKAL